MPPRPNVWALLGLLLLVLLLRQRGGSSVATAVLEPQRAAQVLEQFTTARSDDWPSRSYGNHRARLSLDGGGLAWARVEWRLPGLDMQDRTLLLIDERTGATVRNLHVVSASSEAAEILFEVKEGRKSTGGSARRQPRSGRRPRSNRNEDESYSYDEQPSRKATVWEARKQPGCGCTGHKNAHGFGGFCKAWEEALDSRQTPWCYVSDACTVPDVRRGSFGAKHVDCSPVYADEDEDEEEEEEDDEDEDVSGDEDEDEDEDEEDGGSADDYSYSYDEAEVVRWEPRKTPGCGCTGHKNAHGFGGFCKAWEEALDPGQRPWCYVSDECAAPDVRRGSFGAKHVDCSPVYADAAQGPRTEAAPSGRGGGGGGARRGRGQQRGPRGGASVYYSKSHLQGRRLLASRPPAAASGPRLFSLYYLPYDDRPCVTGPASSCTSRYAPPPGAAVGFRQRARAALQRAGWRERVRRAAVTRFEARTPRDSFAPMEVAATAAETAAVRAHCAQRGRRLLVWAEPRTVPIRMLAALPLRWVGRGLAPPNTTVHRGGMLGSEFYTFQLGVWAPLAPLRVRPRWAAPLRGPSGAELAPWRLRCVNTPNGSEQASSGVAVRRGGVQALWFGLDLPSDAPPGTYRGTVAVEELDGGQVEEVQLELELEARQVEQRGDSEPWRHSRLRWLDSTAGEGPVLASADHGGAHRSRADVWQRVELEAERLRLSASGARKLTLSRRGLPASLAVGSVELLAEPMQAHPTLPMPMPMPHARAYARAHAHAHARAHAHAHARAHLMWHATCRAPLTRPAT